MRRAKIMLTAIAVLATIGGVLASNIHGKRMPNTFFEAEVPGGPCTIQVTVNLTTTIPPAGHFVELSTLPTFGPCPTIRVTIVL